MSYKARCWDAGLPILTEGDWSNSNAGTWSDGALFYEDAGATFVGLVAQTDSEAIVLDYSCPGGICLWRLSDDNNDGVITQTERFPFAPGGPSANTANDPVAVVTLP